MVARTAVLWVVLWVVLSAATKADVWVGKLVVCLVENLDGCWVVAMVAE